MNSMLLRLFVGKDAVAFNVPVAMIVAIYAALGVTIQNYSAPFAGGLLIPLACWGAAFLVLWMLDGKDFWRKPQERRRPF